MLNFLDETIKKLIASEIPVLTPNPEETHVYFEPPDSDFHPSLPAVNLFLYDVRENRDLRSNEWQVDRQNGLVTRQAPPARVDCSYMITAWAGDVASEHALLGQMMVLLLRYQTIPAGMLQGDLKKQPLPLPVNSLGPGRLQSLAEFWQALGGKPKATLQYTVTLNVYARVPIEAGPPVTEVTIRFGPPTQEQ